MNGLAFVQTGALALSLIIALETLLAWWFPAVRHVLPPWMIMKVNGSLLVLCSVGSLAISGRRRSPGLHTLSRFLAAFVGFNALAVLLEYALHIQLGLDTLLAADAASSHPGRMSLETATMFVLLSFVLYLIDTRRRTLGLLVDICLSILCLGNLILVSGYLFGATRVFGTLSPSAPETLLAFMLLSFVAFARRAEWGIFLVLTGNGIGSKVARIACPIILVLPFLLELARERSMRFGWLTPEFGAAVETSVGAMLALALVLFLAWRIESLEREIGELSLRDELTGLYNRRGFYMFAEQALHVARRTGAPLSVLYIDLDNLKQINDTLGHDTGSRFLVEVADLLKESFRKTDVIGRIGGDEFVVAGQSTEAAIKVAVRRMEETARDRDAEPGRAYPFRFSIGYASIQAARQERLEDLINRADRSMYATKREKKLARA
jgi:diguanylate cyclase (GGDEF)-like protein